MPVRVCSTSAGAPVPACTGSPRRHAPGRSGSASRWLVVPAPTSAAAAQVGQSTATGRNVRGGVRIRKSVGVCRTGARKAGVEADGGGKGGGGGGSGNDAGWGDDAGTDSKGGGGDGCGCGGRGDRGAEDCNEVSSERTVARGFVDPAEVAMKEGGGWGNGAGIVSRCGGAGAGGSGPGWLMYADMGKAHGRGRVLPRCGSAGVS